LLANKPILNKYHEETYDAQKSEEKFTTIARVSERLVKNLSAVSAIRSYYADNTEAMLNFYNAQAIFKTTLELEKNNTKVIIHNGLGQPILAVNKSYSRILELTQKERYINYKNSFLTMACKLIQNYESISSTNLNPKERAETMTELVNFHMTAIEHLPTQNFQELAAVSFTDTFAENGEEFANLLSFLKKI
jgi:hypothetical protein